MARIQTPAFILRTVDYGDYHVIAHLLGRDTGRISAMAYGARSSKRRFGGALEPLRVVEATVAPTDKGRDDLMKLEQLDVVESFDGIDESIEAISAGSYATDLTRKTWREGVDAGPAFELLRRFCHNLIECESNAEIARLVHQFEYALLNLYGVAPAIERCSRCGAAPESMDKLRFSRRGEGLICGDCRHRNDTVGIVTPTTLAVLGHLADPEAHSLPDEELDASMAQAGRVLANAIRQLVEGSLDSREMLFDVL